MSIIIGVRCNDCVILAASGPGPTAPQEAAASNGGLSRLRAIAGRAVVGVSGPEELGREMTAALERYLRARDPSGLSGEAHNDGMRTALGQRIRLTADMRRALERLPGAGAAVGESAGEALIAIPSKDSPSLHVVDREGRITEVVRGRSWAVVGPAKLAAESFLGFLQRLLWREGRPNRAAGQLAAYWAARHVTEMEGGSSRSVQLVRVSREGRESSSLVWYGERVITSLRRAVDAGVDEIRAGLRRHVLVDFDVPVEPAAAKLEQPVRPRVPEVRVMLRAPEDKEKRARW